MLKSSLIVKIYIYAVFVLCTGIVSLWLIGESLRDQGRREGLQNFLTPQFAYIGKEVERSLAGDHPSPARLEELSELFRHRLTFIPWSQVPAERREQSIIIDEKPSARTPPRHWIRLERNGQPIGALEVSPEHRPPPRGPFVPHLAWLWVLLLLLIIVPPVWIWVIRPLKSMVAIARRLGSGDLETPVPLVRKDEFGELEHAFEGMRVDLRQTLQKMERLLMDVSHEIRGPLSRMMLALPLLKQESRPGPISEIFERELRLVDELLGDVLALARGRSPNLLVSVDLAELTQSLILERAIVVEQNNQTLESDLKSSIVIGDPRLLTRAMGNLLDNALKYTQSGGRIRILTGERQGECFFQVIDNGPGISPEHLPHVFEPFYRPDDSRSRETGGTGLGLAIVKSIAEHLSGSVSLRSTPDHGTTAELKFKKSD